MSSKKKFWSFKKARAYVRKLSLKTTTEWKAYAKSGDKPDEIPSNPNQYYKDSGWKGYPDWIRNTDKLYKGRYRNFITARQFARKLKLKTKTEWVHYASSGHLPDDIPSYPESVYATCGWVNYGDWLGLKRFNRKFLPYKKARSFVRKLKLENKKEWLEYTRSIGFPDFLPKDPFTAYANSGYINMSDWLGSNPVGSQNRNFLPFNKARLWVRKQKLQSYQEWITYARSGKLPSNIPRAPQYVYKEFWISYPDWLGLKKEGAPRYRKNRTPKITRNFKSARRFVRTLKLNSTKEWIEYSRSEDCPPDIPSYPQACYQEWVSMSDWLGINKKRRRYSRN